MILNDIKISFKIGTGIAIVAMLSVAVGVIGYYGIVTLADGTQETEITHATAQELTAARMETERYVRTPDETTAGNVLSHLAETRALLDQLTDKDADGMALRTRAESAVDTFEENFATMQAVTAEQESINHDLNLMIGLILSAAEGILSDQKMNVGFAQTNANNAKKTQSVSFQAFTMMTAIRDGVRKAETQAKIFQYAWLPEAVEATDFLIVEMIAGTGVLTGLGGEGEYKEAAKQITAAANAYHAAFRLMVENTGGYQESQAALGKLEEFRKLVDALASDQRYAFDKATAKAESAARELVQRQTTAQEAYSLIVNVEQLNRLKSDFSSLTTEEEINAHLLEVQARLKVIEETSAQLIDMTEDEVAKMNAEDAVAAAGRYYTSYQSMIEAARKTHAAGNAVATATVSLSEVMAELNTESVEHLSEIRDNSMTLMIGGVVLALVIAGALGVMTQVTVVSPITRLSGSMRTLANGENSVDVPGADRGDEVGDMAKTVEVFKANGLEKQRLEQEQADSEARAAEDKRKATEELATTFEQSVMGVLSRVGEATGQMRQAVSSMLQSASQTSSSSDDAAHASQQASDNVQAVAAAAEQLAATVAEVSRQIATCVEVAGDAQSSAVETDQSIQELAQSADRIGAAVRLISEVAEQTNLLALNATIEAARAGEAGKGFAVVANEVKALASQTGKATEEISDLVREIQGSTGDAVSRIKHIAETAEKVTEVISSVAAAMEEQGAATSEIARNAEGAAESTSQVVGNMGSVQQQAGSTGSLAEGLMEEVGDLDGGARDLSDAVNGFLQKIRAA